MIAANKVFHYSLMLVRENVWHISSIPLYEIGVTFVVYLSTNRNFFTLISTNDLFWLKLK